jgi:hypothetical protein
VRPIGSVPGPQDRNGRSPLDPARGLPISVVEVTAVRVVKLELDAPSAEPAGAAEALAASPVPSLVVVTWRDAFFDLDQTTADDFRPDYLVNTVGFLVADGPIFVSLAQEVLPDDEGYRAVTHIPRAVVERIVALEHAPHASAQTGE